jgi:hypothetical protein
MLVLLSHGNFINIFDMFDNTKGLANLTSQRTAHSNIRHLNLLLSQLKSILMKNFLLKGKILVFFSFRS